MIIGTPVNSSTQLAQHLQRQRDIDGATHRLASGSKVDRMAKDLGAYSFSARLDSQIRADRLAANSLHNAITYVQTQSDGLRSVDRVLLRMDELAMQASDPSLTSRDRLRYQSEFSSLQTHLAYMAVEKFNQEILFDPQASKYADVYPVTGVSDGGWEMQEQVVDIGALRGGIRLWWDSTWQTDRLKVYQGASLLFDSGEYRSRHWVNYPYYENHSDPAFQKPTVFNGSGDIFQIDFEPESVTVTPDPGNVGVSLQDKDNFEDLRRMTGDDEWAKVYGGDSIEHYLDYYYTTSEDYPKSGTTAGDSTEIRFVVNEDSGGFPSFRDSTSTTVWEYQAEITKESVSAKSVLAAGDGSTIEIDNIGFSTLGELSLKTLQGALTALDVIRLEQENIRYQQGVIGAEISRFRSQAGVLERKTTVEARSLSRIVDTDFAEDSTHLAKNLMLRDISSAVLAQARVNAAHVVNLLI